MINSNSKLISLRSEFTKAFPPFLIYLGTIIILLSFLKDLVRVGFHLSWLLIRVGYLPFVITVWVSTKNKLINSRFYETPLWLAGLYITLLCTYFSFATGGIKSDYIYGLIQFYFAIAIMPITAITFYVLSLSSIAMYIGLNIVNFKPYHSHDYTMVSTLIPLLVFPAIVYFITSRVRRTKINLHNTLSTTLLKMDETIQIQSKKLAHIETKETLSTVALQMAHDIRSPLSALNVISEELDQLPEALRTMTRGAITRINDIANNLLNKYKQSSSSDNAISSELIAIAVDSVISETRVNIKNTHIKLNYIVDITAQGIFAKVQLIEFKRVISNLINNAIESIVNQGQVDVTIESKNDCLLIEIKDNGCGIAPENFKNLFFVGHTTKENGLGLGLAHAKKTIEFLGGEIIINSVSQQGTIVTLKLLNCACPTWFAPTLELHHDSTIVVIDDDPSIAKVWESRVSTLLDQHSIKIIYFSNTEDLSKWHKTSSHLHTIYLCDYEFVEQSTTGLSRIAQLKIADSSYLVTSHYEDAEIRNRCIELNLKIIPKNFSAYIPIHIIH